MGGWLTFCRELSLEDGALRSRPAAELGSLRRDAFDVQPDTPFTADAFELEVGSGAAALWLVDGGGEELVAASRGRARILVDGSVVEVFDTLPAPLTTRAYPTATSAWVLRAAGAPVAAWRLGAEL